MTFESKPVLKLRIEYDTSMCTSVPNDNNIFRHKVKIILYCFHNLNVLIGSFRKDYIFIFVLKTIKGPNSEH